MFHDVLHHLIEHYPPGDMLHNLPPVALAPRFGGR